jgi:hypothetical protein
MVLGYVFVSGFDRGGLGTRACALRRKIYDPRRVEGTPSPGYDSELSFSDFL